MRYAGELKAHIVHLLFNCPVSGGNPADCPLAALRAQPFREALNTLEQWDLGAQLQVWHQHRSCSRMQGKGRPALFTQ